MKTIIYVSVTLPEKLYKIGIPDDNKIDQQANKFNRSMMKGFIANGYKVYAVSQRKYFLGEEGEYEEDSILYNIIKGSNYFEIVKKSYSIVKCLLNQNPKASVICDALSLSICTGAVFAAKKHKKVGIITDIPGVSTNGCIKIFLDKFLMKYTFSSYVFLTENMNKLMNPRRMPYCIMEGLYYGKNDIQITEKKDEKIFTVLYAGFLHKKYGIPALINVFLELKNKPVFLHLYGTGDYVEQIKQASKEANIIYHGVRDNSEVVEAEKEASLLINPRSKNEIFTKYSFPSKTIEYMSTGTPVLMQELPGMPEEYKPYLYFYDDNEESLKNAILKIMEKSIDERNKKGKDAKEFILNNKTAKMQTKKIIETLYL